MYILLFIQGDYIGVSLFVRNMKPTDKLELMSPWITTAKDYESCLQFEAQIPTECQYDFEIGVFLQTYTTDQRLFIYKRKTGEP